MERNKQQIPGIVQKDCKRSYREDVPEYSTGENEGGASTEGSGSPHRDVSSSGGREILTKEHLPSEKAGEILSNGLEGASIH